jgi:hypothetical protein
MERYYLLSVDQNRTAGVSQEVTVKGFKKCCITKAMDETDDMLWNGREEDGNVRNGCEKTKALIVKMETSDDC